MRSQKLTTSTTAIYTDAALLSMDMTAIEQVIRTGTPEPAAAVPGAATPGGLCGDCSDNACLGTRKLRDYQFCPAFVPAPAAGGPAVPELEEKQRGLSAKLPQLVATLRTRLLAQRDVEYLVGQCCPVTEKERGDVGGAAAQARSELAVTMAELKRLGDQLEARRAQVARLEVWNKLCQNRPQELARLALARENWRAAGFTMADAVDQNIPGSARLPYLRRLNDAAAELRAAADALRIIHPELAKAGAASLWDLTIPENAMN